MWTDVDAWAREDLTDTFERLRYIAKKSHQSPSGERATKDRETGEEARFRTISHLSSSPSLTNLALWAGQQSEAGYLISKARNLLPKVHIFPRGSKAWETSGLRLAASTMGRWTVSPVMRHRIRLICGTATTFETRALAGQ